MDAILTRLSKVFSKASRTGRVPYHGGFNHEFVQGPDEGKLVERNALFETVLNIVAGLVLPIRSCVCLVADAVPCQIGVPI